MMEVELRQFRYFIAVAEERHFGRAAELLRISQPGLSQQIKAVERGLGVQLFVRDKRGVTLTEAGEKLLDHARQVIQLADRAAETARLSTSGKTALLKVGTPLGGIHPTSNRVLQAFQARNPAIEVQISPGFVARNIEALIRRTLDVAFVLAPFESPQQGLRYLQLGKVELLAALPAGHRLARLERIPRAELMREPFLDWARRVNPTLIDHLHRLLFGEMEHPRSIEVADVVDSSRLMLVAEGEGIAVVLHPSLAELHIPSIVFRPLAEPAHLDHGMAWLDILPSPIVPAFVDLARELAATSA
jgi:DNA-binding transcriptional LysR family regulator